MLIASLREVIRKQATQIEDLQRVIGVGQERLRKVLGALPQLHLLQDLVDGLDDLDARLLLLRVVPDALPQHGDADFDLHGGSVRRTDDEGVSVEGCAPSSRAR